MWWGKKFFEADHNGFGKLQVLTRFDIPIFSNHLRNMVIEYSGIFIQIAHEAENKMQIDNNF